MDDRSSVLFRCLDEQAAVNFTGKVNVLEASDKRLLGVVTLKDGAIHGCSFQGILGLKAFHALLIREASGGLSYVVEPEIVADEGRNIPLPLRILKERAAMALERWNKVAQAKPPSGLKLLVKPEFLEAQSDVSVPEFHVLCALAEWGVVEDLYKNCPLLEYEITEALVGLRKKDALQVVGSRAQGP